MATFQNGENLTALRDKFIWIYAIAAAGALAQYAVSFAMVLSGCVILWACDRMLDRQRAAARGTPFESHATWLRRTQRIGGTYLLPPAVLVMFWLIFEATPAATLMRDIIRNQITSPVGIENLLAEYLARYGATVNRITYICISPPIFWWVWRCWTGFARARKSEPIGSPTAFI